jgi:hypothetical protein
MPLDTTGICLARSWSCLCRRMPGGMANRRFDALARGWTRTSHLVAAVSVEPPFLPLCQAGCARVSRCSGATPRAGLRSHCFSDARSSRQNRSNLSQTTPIRDSESAQFKALVKSRADLFVGNDVGFKKRQRNEPRDAAVCRAWIHQPLHLARQPERTDLPGQCPPRARGDFIRREVG